MHTKMRRLNEVQSRLALYNDFILKGQDSVERMEKINELILIISIDSYRRCRPYSSDSDSDGIPDGWEYCYATYGMADITTQDRWASNPINAWDVNYDGDSDGWYNRTSFDTPGTL